MPVCVAEYILYGLVNKQAVNDFVDSRDGEVRNLLVGPHQKFYLIPSLDVLHYDPKQP